jgi:chorismate synthase
VTRQPFEASRERSDVCAVPAAAVIVESAVAFILTRSFLEKFGGDSLSEIARNYHSYVEYLKQY